MKCAFYESDITPFLGCSMPGYFNVRFGTDVKDRLYAKAAVISDGANVAAILAIDSVGITTETCAAITGRIGKYTDLKPESVMICATHTHTGGPRIESELYITGKCRNNKTDRLYLEVMRIIAADCVILAYKRLRDAKAGYGQSVVDSISFNRNYLMKDGTVRTNPGRLNPDILKPFAGIDPDLRVMYFEDEKNKPCGAIINFACHQDCVSGTGFTGDFSSVISKELKKVYGSDFVCLFIAGACGNINHIDVSKGADRPDHYEMMGIILADEAQKAIGRRETLMDGPVIVRKQYIKIKRRIPTEKDINKAIDKVNSIKPMAGVKLAADARSDQFELAMAQRLLLYAESEEKYADVCVQVVKIGECLIYALPYEIFMQFGQYIGKKSPSGKYMIATLCNGSRGYIPAKELFLPYVYESRTGVTSPLVPEAGRIISDKALEMANAMINDYRN